MTWATLVSRSPSVAPGILPFRHISPSLDKIPNAATKSELAADYAKLYGLTRDELRYILDPADVIGEDYPSETFRVLKNKEIKEYGEYRTQRLVLEAFDTLAEVERRDRRKVANS